MTCAGRIENCQPRVAERDFATFNRIYAEYLGNVQPTRTTVGVDSLPTPIAVELKIIAAV